MTLKAEVIVGLNQHLGIYRTVRIVTNRATFAHRFMFKNKRASLVAMTFSAGLIESPDAEPTGGLHDISAMRIVALHTVHFPFNHRVMLRQGEFRVGLEMALETGSGIFARIQNKLTTTATDFDVFTPGTVTSLASTLPGSGIGSELHSSVSAGGKDPNIVGVTLKARFVANVIGPGNGRAHHDRSGGCRTGVCQA